MNILAFIGGEKWELFKNKIKKNMPLLHSALNYIKPSVEVFFLKHFQNFIFIHIPKNAGTSIERALGIPILNHDTCISMKRKIGDKRFNNRFKFAFVRNPYDREVSLYKYKLKENKDTAPSSFLKMTFEEWLGEKWRQHEEYGKVIDLQLYEHAWPQMQYLKNEENEIVVDFIGKFENLNSDFEFVKKKLGVKATLPHLKPSNDNGKGYRSYYSETSKSIVENIYKEDFEHFDYTF